MQNRQDHHFDTHNEVKDRKRESFDNRPVDVAIDLRIRSRSRRY